MAFICSAAAQLVLPASGRGKRADAESPKPLTLLIDFSMDVVSLANLSPPAENTGCSYLRESGLQPGLMIRPERAMACRPPCGLTARWRGEDCYRLLIQPELLNQRPFFRLQAA